MDNLVNIVRSVNRQVRGSGITVSVDGDFIVLKGAKKRAALRIVRLQRPSSADVERAGRSRNVILVLHSPSRKAAETAENFNHIIVPDGGFRIIAPGIAVSCPQTILPIKAKRTSISGKTGVVAETLLLDGSRKWSVLDLASSAKVSPALAHRVLARLESERLMSAQGAGPEKLRMVENRRALAEVWSEEEARPMPVLRGYLYGASDEKILEGALSAIPGSAVGGVYAANFFEPVLTRIPSPFKLWAPESFDRSKLMAKGFETTQEGANLEVFTLKGDPWIVHAKPGKMPVVSPWRAWLEISLESGRTAELAAALLASLEKGKTWK